MPQRICRCIFHGAPHVHTHAHKCIHVLNFSLVALNGSFITDRSLSWVKWFVISIWVSCIGHSYSQLQWKLFLLSKNLFETSFDTDKVSVWGCLSPYVGPSKVNSALTQCQLGLATLPRWVVKLMAGCIDEQVFTITWTEFDYIIFLCQAEVWLYVYPQGKEGTQSGISQQSRLNLTNSSDWKHSNCSKLRSVSYNKSQAI